MLISDILCLVARLEDIRKSKFDMQENYCFTLALDKQTFDAVSVELSGLMLEDNGKLKGLGVTIELKT